MKSPIGCFGYYGGCPLPFPLSSYTVILTDPEARSIRVWIQIYRLWEVIKLLDETALGRGLDAGIATIKDIAYSTCTSQVERQALPGFYTGYALSILSAR
jgi:hypothetical protein